MLREEDDDVAHRFTEVYQRRFNMVLGSQLTSVSAADGVITVEVNTNGERQSIDSDCLFMPTGRVPNTDILNVAATGVEIDYRGFVKADDILVPTSPASGRWATLLASIS